MIKKSFSICVLALLIGIQQAPAESNPYEQEGQVLAKSFNVQPDVAPFCHRIVATTIFEGDNQGDFKETIKVTLLVILLPYWMMDRHGRSIRKIPKPIAAGLLETLYSL